MNDRPIPDSLRRLSPDEAAKVQVPDDAEIERALRAGQSERDALEAHGQKRPSMDPRMRFA